MSPFTDNDSAVCYIALLHGCIGLQCHPTLIIMEQCVALPFYTVVGGYMPSYTDNNGAMCYIALLHGCRGLHAILH